MKAVQRIVWCCLMGAAASITGTAQSGQTDAMDRPPFWPPWYHPEAPPPPPVPNRLDHLEFRGVLSVAGQTFVTLVDTTSSRTLTIPLDQCVEDVAVFDLRVNDGTVHVQSAGQDRLLALREAKIVPMAPPPAPSPQRSPMVGLQRPGDRVDEVRREIARRREVRRQLLAAGNSSKVSTSSNPPDVDP